jgi:hypothetical protein
LNSRRSERFLLWLRSKNLVSVPPYCYGPGVPIESEKEILLRRIRVCICIFIIGLTASGLTAIPLTRELSVLYRGLHYFGVQSGPLHDWIQEVFAALLDAKARYPFLQYGTDWLAFGHFVVALVFLGPLRDPARNIWVIQFGIMACLLVIPYALIFGAIRGIPGWWRLIDCSFGVLGLVPLKLALQMTKSLQRKTSL